MTHEFLVQRAAKWLRNTHRCSVVLAEFAGGFTGEIPDAIGWRGRWSVLVEAKTSRGDFRADRHKPSRRTEWRLGQERWYMTPAGLVKPHEVPEGWGLVEVFPSGALRRIVEAPRGGLNHETALKEVPVLVAALQRHQMGVRWLPEVSRFEGWNPDRERVPSPTDEG